MRTCIPEVEEISLKKIPRLAFLIPVTALILAGQGPPPGDFGGGPGFGPKGGRGHGRPEQVVTGAPYSGTLTEQRQQTLPDGNQISRQTVTKVYRDSEGRVRKEITTTGRNGQTHQFVTLFDPLGGFEARLNPQKLTAEKHPLPPQRQGEKTPPAPPSGEDGPQIKTEDLGSNTIEGQAATGKRVTVTIPAGEMDNPDAVQIVREIWTSTVLKVPVLITSTNPHFGKSTTQLTGISQGEPDAALFQIPSNYKVTTRTGLHGPPGFGGHGPAGEE
jgi:hypothetical protein